MTSVFQQPCPCGSGTTYDDCCGPFHRGTPAPTAEALMRSRYSAFAMGDANYLFRTWHPRTRPADVGIDDETQWTGLTILGSGEDWVEFEAHYLYAGREGRMRERSRFEQRAGKWVYLDGD